jgi:ubiquinone/menaquinone biosynthesis C-methylase UbiE
MTSPNGTTAPTLVFGSEIARNYDEYMVPLIFDDYARDLARVIARQPDAKVLETAAGTGALTRHLLDRLNGSSRIVATDLNEGMLDLAATKTNGQVNYRLADACDLPFDDASFDAVGCQFGVMFFPDRARGFAEAARVLRPGGQFAFNLWDSLEHNPLAGIVHETVNRMHADDPIATLTVPFARQDLSTIKDELEAAGFTDIEIAVLPDRSRAESARDVVQALVLGSPLRVELEERGSLDEATHAVESALIAEFGDGAIDAPMQATRISAVRS